MQVFSDRADMPVYKEHDLCNLAELYSIELSHAMLLYSIVLMGASRFR